MSRIKPDAITINICTDLKHDFQNFRIILELDTNLLEQFIGIVLNEFQTFI